MTEPPPRSIGSADPPALGDLLATAAAKWPDRAAVGDGQTSYTFAELERGARAIAARLGVGPGDRVVVLAEKRAVMPVLVLAIWKCGAVYVPLDAAEPPGRLRELLARLRPALVVALDDRDPVAGSWLGGTGLAAALAAPADHPTVAHGPGDAAYVVLASGPTGRPQGVENSAGALLAGLDRLNGVLGLSAESRVLSLSPFTVDVSFLDTLLPLSVGAYVHQFRGLPAGAVLRATLGKERITHLVAVSMLLELITGDGRRLTGATLPDLELVLTGAQVCDPAVVNLWRRQRPGVRFVHAFGPPEATVFSLTYEVGAERDAYPVGRPLPGLAAEIVDGELWVGGDQVMRGYVDQPEETARVLVERDGTRWFRTGDRGHVDEDGELVFDGHADPEVVWLAGRRTHLNELRRAALACPGVEGAVAAVVPGPRRDVLALVVLAAERPAMDAVAAHLRDLLPEHLRPGLTAWSPAVTDPPAAVIRRLTAAAEQSNAPYLEV